MDLSIVSGTYNRLQYLMNMVESARRPLRKVEGIEYEFVLVDGGSMDGTIGWCQNQPDVRLIEHGTLKGAVKAFNDGAFAASGDYVILANDDIEFVEDSVLRALVFIRQRPECGIGCFYQDRGGKGWHVENMPIVRDGRQAYAPYGQVCIIPKWLGDRVGWWGDYLHTYGGDNELSSQVYETGYKVIPIEGCKIHDNEPNDGLRKINNISGAHDPRAVRGHHPDSWAWGKRWRDEARNLVGPRIRDDLLWEPQTAREERFLYLPIFETGWPVQKEQKRGLREALALRGTIKEIDYIGIAAADGKEKLLEELAEWAVKIQPTVCLFQLHGADPLGPADVEYLRKVIPDATFVNWNGDYWPDNLLTEQGMALARAFDYQLIVNRAVLEEYVRMGVKAAYWQIGWEPDGVGHDPMDRCEVAFLANGYSKERQRLVKDLRGLGLDFHLWGKGWSDGWARGECLYDFEQACRVYRGAKISLGDSQWPDSGFVSNRVFQALAAGGSALAHQRFRGMEDLGLVDGETVIAWHSFGDLAERLRHYLSHEEDRARIASAGEQLALERHSFDRRVEELFDIIGQPKVGWQDGWR